MMTAPRGEALGWNDVIPNPRAKAERVPTPAPVAHGGGMSAALEVLRSLPGFKGNPDKFTAQCPGHEDRENSLSVELRDSKTLVHCFAGCPTADVLAAVGLRLVDLQPAAPQKKQIECTYDYRDAAGKLLYQAVRYRPKSFTQRRPDATAPGGYKWSLDGTDRVLYRLPDVLKAKADGRTIYLCEGEKDTDRLVELGLCATTIAGGAAAPWKQSFTDLLQGADVVVLADNDLAGITAAQARAGAVGAVVLLLPGLPPKGDVSDWLDAGGTLEALQALVADARNNPVAIEPVPVEAQPTRPDVDPLGELAGGDTTPRSFPRFTDMTGSWELADTPIPQLFKEAMPLGELAVLVSEPGTGKSHLALGLGLSVVFARGLVAGFTPTRRGRVLLLFGEDSLHPVAQRARAWCEAHDITRDEYYAAITDGRLTFLCGESAELLAFEYGVCKRTAAHAELLRLAQAERWDLVVVDSLIQWSGAPNENDNTMMRQAAEALIDVAKATGGVVLALHHTNKASDKTGATGLHAIRGGGALGGRTRCALQLLKFTSDDLKFFKIPHADRKKYLRLEEIKVQYNPEDGDGIVLERGPGGVLMAVKLKPPKAEDTLLALARVLVDTLGENAANIPKWDLIQKKRGADFRAQLKVYRKDATIQNIGIAYDLAIKNEWIAEEEVDTGRGNSAKIPRKVEEEAA